MKHIRELAAFRFSLLVWVFLVGTQIPTTAHAQRFGQWLRGLFTSEGRATVESLPVSQIMAIYNRSSVVRDVLRESPQGRALGEGFIGTAVTNETQLAQVLGHLRADQRQVFLRQLEAVHGQSLISPDDTVVELSRHLRYEVGYYRLRAVRAPVHRRHSVRMQEPEYHTAYARGSDRARTALEYEQAIQRFEAADIADDTIWASRDVEVEHMNAQQLAYYRRHRLSRIDEELRLLAQEEEFAGAIQVSQWGSDGRTPVEFIVREGRARPANNRRANTEHDSDLWSMAQRRRDLELERDQLVQAQQEARVGFTRRTGDRYRERQRRTRTRAERRMNAKQRRAAKRDPRLFPNPLVETHPELRRSLLELRSTKGTRSWTAAAEYGAALRRVGRQLEAFQDSRGYLVVADTAEEAQRFWTLMGEYLDDLRLDTSQALDELALLSRRMEQRIMRAGGDERPMADEILTALEGQLNGRRLEPGPRSAARGDVEEVLYAAGREGWSSERTANRLVAIMQQHDSGLVLNRVGAFRDRCVNILENPPLATSQTDDVLLVLEEELATRGLGQAAERAALVQRAERVLRNHQNTRNRSGVRATARRAAEATLDTSGFYLKSLVVPKRALTPAELSFLTTGRFSWLRCQIFQLILRAHVLIGHLFHLIVQVLRAWRPFYSSHGERFVLVGMAKGLMEMIFGLLRWLAPVPAPSVLEGLPRYLIREVGGQRGVHVYEPFTRLLRLRHPDGVHDLFRRQWRNPEYLFEDVEVAVSRQTNAFNWMWDMVYNWRVEPFRPFRSRARVRADVVAEREAMVGLLNRRQAWEAFADQRAFFVGSPLWHRFRRFIHLLGRGAVNMSYLAAIVYMLRSEEDDGVMSVDSYLNDPRHKPVVGPDFTEAHIIVNLVPFPHLAIRMGDKVYSYGQTHLQVSTVTEYFKNKQKGEHAEQMRTIRSRVLDSNPELANPQEQLILDIKRFQDEAERENPGSMAAVSGSVNLDSLTGLLYGADGLLKMMGMAGMEDSIQVIPIRLRSEDVGAMKAYLEPRDGMRYDNNTGVNDCATMILRALADNTNFSYGALARAFDASPGQVGLMMGLEREKEWQEAEVRAAASGRTVEEEYDGAIGRLMTVVVHESPEQKILAERRKRLPQGHPDKGKPIELEEYRKYPHLTRNALINVIESKLFVSFFLFHQGYREYMEQTREKDGRGVWEWHEPKTERKIRFVLRNQAREKAEQEVALQEMAEAVRKMEDGLNDVLEERVGDEEAYHRMTDRERIAAWSQLEPARAEGVTRVDRQREVLETLDEALKGVIGEDEFNRYSGPHERAELWEDHLGEEHSKMMEEHRILTLLVQRDKIHLVATEAIADQMTTTREFTQENYTAFDDIWINYHYWMELAAWRDQYMPIIETGWQKPVGEVAPFPESAREIFFKARPDADPSYFGDRGDMRAPGKK